LDLLDACSRHVNEMIKILVIIFEDEIKKLSLFWDVKTHVIKKDVKVLLENVNILVEITSFAVEKYREEIYVGLRLILICESVFNFWFN
jgi:hypothetical protein